jgi:hypothetical protein
MGQLSREAGAAAESGGGAKSPIRIAMYLLPGPTRTADRLVPVGKVKLSDYVLGKTKAEGATLWDPKSAGVAQGILCEWPSGQREIFPYVIPCYFCDDWTSLEAAADSMGCELAKGPAVEDDEQIGRSVVTTLICLLDGTLHECKRFGVRMMLQARQWPVRFDVGVLGVA